METIPIFFTFDRYYVLAACVAFHSLLTNAAPEYQYQLYVDIPTSSLIIYNE